MKRISADRKARGAFFTPEPIAQYLAEWAVKGDPNAKVLDPTCGEAVFLLAAADKLRELGCPPSRLDQQVYGVDLDADSLREASKLLESRGLDAHLMEEDFFRIANPGQLGCPLPEMDAVIGNPPFIRYQHHKGDARKRSAAAALAQGVRLSGLASSWASVLVHACAFLKRDGRLAIVLPEELLTVHYAEPIRRWLRGRFAAVHLVMFERLQFADALEKVVLVVARGSGGCEAFSMHYLTDAEDLYSLHAFDNFSVAPADEGKWSDLWLTIRQRQVFRSVTEELFQPLQQYGTPELGTVTGANDFFTLSNEARESLRLRDDEVVPISPPGTRHLKGLSFTDGDWNRLRDAGDAVWMLRPERDEQSPGLRAYVRRGEADGVHRAYKCQIRVPWWRPPRVPVPDLFFTYMSHRYPRLIANTARVAYVNSMHGLRLRPEAPKESRSALPLLCLNSVTMLGAEVHGRAYGGGILKMEPREAATLPVPKQRHLIAAWKTLRDDRPALDRQLRQGLWTNVAKQVDDVLLRQVMQIDPVDVAELHEAARSLRERRIGPTATVQSP